MMQPMPGTTDHPVNQEAINHQFTARADIRHVVAGLGGLGLHLAALHANAMGARIKVEDRSGGGAVFSVRFKPARS